MKKRAIDLKIGDEIMIGLDRLIIKSVETSDMGKQGTKKVRIESQKSNGEKIIIIRPADYPLNCI